MRVEILRGVVIDGGKTTQPGDKVEVSDALAKLLIAKGKAKVAPAPKKTAKKDD